MMRRGLSAVVVLSLVWVLGACALLDSGTAGEIPPTVAQLDQVPTTVFLTENAPPPGFSTFSAPSVDVNLSGRQGWAYTVSGRFKGTFDDDGSRADGELSAVIRADVLSEAQHVVLEVEGAALRADDTQIRLEAVRFSNDVYLVDVNGVCSSDESGAPVADLSAGQLIGGVRTATPTGFQDDIQGVHVWQYGFRVEDVVLPDATLKMDANSAVRVEANLWVSPDLNAVVQYELTLQVTGVRLLSSERPVSGTLYLRYDLDVAQFDTLPNISVPNGC